MKKLLAFVFSALMIMSTLIGVAGAIEHPERVDEPAPVSLPNLNEDGELEYYENSYADFPGYGDYYLNCGTIVFKAGFLKFTDELTEDEIRALLPGVEFRHAGFLGEPLDENGELPEINNDNYEYKVGIQFFVYNKRHPENWDLYNVETFSSYVDKILALDYVKEFRLSYRDNADHYSTLRANIEYTSGDVNGDGETNARDLQKILQYIVGYEIEGAFDLDIADVYPDGKINSRDANAVMLMIIGSN